MARRRHVRAALSEAGASYLASPIQSSRRLRRWHDLYGGHGSASPRQRPRSLRSGRPSTTRRATPARRPCEAEISNASAATTVAHSLISPRFPRSATTTHLRARARTRIESARTKNSWPRWPLRTCSNSRRAASSWKKKRGRVRGPQRSSLGRTVDRGMTASRHPAMWRLCSSAIATNLPHPVASCHILAALPDALFAVWLADSEKGCSNDQPSC